MILFSVRRTDLCHYDTDNLYSVSKSRRDIRLMPQFFLGEVGWWQIVIVIVIVFVIVIWILIEISVTLICHFEKKK